MRRVPVPPRVTVSRHQKSESEMKDILKKRGPIQAVTFDEAKAREHTIVPPKYSEKNLYTKRQPQREKIEMPSQRNQQSEFGSRKQFRIKDSIMGGETSGKSPGSDNLSERRTMDSNGGSPAQEDMPERYGNNSEPHYS